MEKRILKLSKWILKLLDQKRKSEKEGTKNYEISTLMTLSSRRKSKQGESQQGL
mgnify:CR=1 FL=1